MKPLLRAAWTAITLVVVLGLALAPAPGIMRVRAEEENPPGPDRAAAITVDYISYEWWLVRWQDNDIACQIFVDHEDLPTHSEVFNACGEDLYELWVDTVPCETATCNGYYLLFLQSAPAHRVVSVALPPPVVWVSLEGCTSMATTHLCDERSTLVLTGEEPLPNERIDRLEGFVNGQPFICDPVCQVELSPTDADGMELQFWAWSTYGDSSLVYEARVRVIDAAMEDRNQVAWFVDVISSQWRGNTLAGCSQTWESFPPVGGPPAWLQTPESPQELATDIPYEYLASNLLIQGIADADECADEGFLPNGQVSPCGLDAARPAVYDWQDRFDVLIYDVAVESGVPAQLLKSLFSRESQFWPGVVANRPEVGLGQLTENGADTTLLWNLTFFEQFCPYVLDEDTCALGYAGLEEEQQEMLRGALIQNVDAFCPTCPLSIDLYQADSSIQFFAETLIANCEQTSMIVYNTYHQAPGEVASYEDLWRFTLVNYNAGPGCLILAIQDTSNLGEPLDWEHVSSHLTPVCQGARGYVEDISR